MIPTLQLGQFGRAQEGGEADPFLSNVSLLLHMDTDFNDSSPVPKTPTITGGATISTAQAKFGAGSGLFDGQTDGVNYPVSSAFAFDADFCVEMFYMRTSDASSRYYFSTSSANPAWIWLSRPNTVLQAHVFGTYLTASVNPTLNTWYHIALTRSGSTVRFFVDGVQEASATVTTVGGDTGVFVGSAAPGITSADFYHAGHIDEVRISKGVARYTANFAPPTAPF